MKKLVTFLIILTASSLAFAKIDGVTCGNLLYPANSEDQNFAAKFFEIVELHKTSDPLLEGHGPSARDFSLDKIKFAFMANLRDQKVDLVFFNWNLMTFSGLKEDDELSACYGSPVYILKDLDRKSIATQGASWDQLTNFS